MKARLIRDDLEVSLNPGQVLTPEMEKHTNMRLVKRNGRKVPARFWNEGAVLESPDAYRLVQMGCAEPADDECVKAAGVDPDMVESRKQAYERVSRGIHPDDYAAFDAGYMSGYDGGGQWIPGPNYAEFLALEAAYEDDDEEEYEVDGQ